MNKRGDTILFLTCTISVVTIIGIVLLVLFKPTSILPNTSNSLFSPFADGIKTTTFAPNTSTGTPNVSEPKTYTDLTYGFSFTYPANWFYFVRVEDLDCCAKIVFLPTSSSNPTYNANIPTDIVETIAPVNINISKVIANSFSVDDYIQSQVCLKTSVCNPEQASDILIAGTNGKRITTEDAFSDDTAVFLKKYNGTAPSGMYVFSISLRKDAQTQKLYPNLDPKIFDQILKSFQFLPKYK